MSVDVDLPVDWCRRRVDLQRDVLMAPSLVLDSIREPENQQPYLKFRHSHAVALDP